MIKIRSNMKSSIEFSVSTKTGNSSKNLTVKLERSKQRGADEFINEISDEEYKALQDDASGVFKALTQSGELQVIRDDEDGEDSNVTLTPEYFEKSLSEKLEAYKEGDGAELVKTSVDKALEDAEKLLDQRIEKENADALKEAKIAWESEAKTKIEKSVKDVKDGLIKRHNAEKEKGTLKKW
jgi:hypothetical protein